MNIFTIKKFVRNDGATLEIDRNELYLAKENELLRRPEVETTYVDYTEADGGEYIAQKLPTHIQDINGLLVKRDSDYWAIVARLTTFFKARYQYYIVYEKKSGETFTAGEKFKTGAAWIESALQIMPRAHEDYAEWQISLRIGEPGLQEYRETPGGEEIYANEVKVPLFATLAGGIVWDTKGAVWDSRGLVWQGGGSSDQVFIDSTRAIYPVWEIAGPCANPKITNATTGTVAQYNGLVFEGQKLVIDLAAGTAMLDGQPMTRNLTGTLKLTPGANSVVFEAANAGIEYSTLKWNNYID